MATDDPRVLGWIGADIPNTAYAALMFWTEKVICNAYSADAVIYYATLQAVV